MTSDESINLVASELDLQLKEQNFDRGRALIAIKINELIETDFSRLVMILYRMDVSEEKLRLLLKQNPGTDAGLLIADLMIERQSQKIRSRQQFRKPKNNIDENEAW